MKRKSKPKSSIDSTPYVEVVGYGGKTFVSVDDLIVVLLSAGEIDPERLIEALVSLKDHKPTKKVTQ